MTKPWEQDWNAVKLNDPQWAVSATGGVYISGTLAGNDEVNAKFIAAAPDMARALIELLPDGEVGPKPPAHTRECLMWRQERGVIRECLPGCMETLGALRKAGVIP